MAKYLYLYKGEATPPENMSSEQRQEIMGKWGKWMEKVGGAVADMGAPLNPQGASVLDNGNSGKVEPLSGYTIVEAADLETARQLTDGHPFLSDGDGKFSIEIYELMAVPDM
jgi:hypothetical protein